MITEQTRWNNVRSLDHVSGWQCVRGVFNKAGIPRYITATDMRHEVSTRYAAEDVSPEDRDFFISKHLGHSKFINENVYQCPPAIREMRTAGKFLLKLDSIMGKNFVFHYGLSLEDILWAG